MLKAITSQKVKQIIGTIPIKAQQLQADYKHITFLIDSNGSIYEKISYKDKLLIVYVYNNSVYKR